MWASVPVCPAPFGFTLPLGRVRAMVAGLVRCPELLQKFLSAWPSRTQNKWWGRYDSRARGPFPRGTLLKAARFRPDRNLLRKFDAVRT
jgi:hypothetical protein